MNEKKSYAGIDLMRFIAAFLIVAIHTLPLAAQSITADFVLTRVIARVAVPFFFMTSGFFLISKYGRADKLKSFLRRTAVIYGAAILLYIPVNIYNGYFTSDDLLPKLIKDVVFDGTFYHLWYLPASMLGAVIAWYAVKGLALRRRLQLPRRSILSERSETMVRVCVAGSRRKKLLRSFGTDIRLHEKRDIFCSGVYGAWRVDS